MTNTRTRGEIKSLCCGAKIYYKSEYITPFCSECRNLCDYEEIFSSDKTFKIHWGNIFSWWPLIYSIAWIIIVTYSFTILFTNLSPTTFESYQHKTTQAKVFELLNAQLTVREADKMMAVAYCESRFEQFATHANKNGSIDRGVWQISNKFHKEVSDECSFNIRCSTSAAIKIFKQRNFKEWRCAKIYNIK